MKKIIYIYMCWFDFSQFLTFISQNFICYSQINNNSLQFWITNMQTDFTVTLDENNFFGIDFDLRVKQESIPIHQIVLMISNVIYFFKTHALEINQIEQGTTWLQIPGITLVCCILRHIKISKAKLFQEAMFFIIIFTYQR